MKAYRRWLSGHEVKTIGYLNNDDAYNAGTEAGWRAALEWAKKKTREDDIQEGYHLIDVFAYQSHLDKELEDTK